VSNVTVEQVAQDPGDGHQLLYIEFSSHQTEEDSRSCH